MRPAEQVEADDFRGDGAQLGLFGAVNNVGVILAFPKDGLLLGIALVGVIGHFIAGLIPGFHFRQLRVGAHGGKFQVGGNGLHVQLINFAEFFRFGEAGTSHAGQLFVHAEVILNGDGGVGDVFGLDLDAFLGFDGLM